MTDDALGKLRHDLTYCGVRQEHFAAVSQRAQPCTAVHLQTEQALVRRRHFTDVDCAADDDPLACGPVLGSHPLVHVERRGNRCADR